MTEKDRAVFTVCSLFLPLLHFCGHSEQSTYYMSMVVMHHDRMGVGNRNRPKFQGHAILREKARKSCTKYCLGEKLLKIRIFCFSLYIYFERNTFNLDEMILQWGGGQHWEQPEQPNGTNDNSEF